MITRVWNFITGKGFATEYCERFMQPIRERADLLGVPDDMQHQMWRLAVKVAQPVVIGLAPGSIMQNLLDHWEENPSSCRQFVEENSKELGVR